MLRLAQKGRTYDVPIKLGDEETIFVLHAMNIGERQDMIETVQGLSAKDGELPFKVLIATLNERIVSIKGYDEDVTTTLYKMEFIDDLMEITKQIIEFAGLTGDQEKNSPSSSAQSIAASAGSVETTAKPDGEPASPKQTNKVRS